MGRPKPKYRHGDRYAICDECGFKFHLSDLMKRWDGLLVCRTDWEPEHEQRRLYVRPELMRDVECRPEKDDVFLTTDITVDDL